MSVHRDKRSGHYYVKWRERGIQRSRSGFKRKGDADRLDERIKLDQLMGRPVLFRGEVPSFSEFARAWLLRREKRAALATNTVAFDGTLIDKHLNPFIGDLSLVDLTPRRLSAWQREAQDAGSAYMVQRATQLLVNVLDQAVRDEYLVGNPASSLEAVKHRRRAGQALSPQRVEAIRGWFFERERVGDALAVSLLAYVGLRPDELFAMRWPNLHGSRYFVEHKNVDGELLVIDSRKGGPRWVELPRLVLVELRSWQHGLGGLVFPRRKDGAPWTKADRNNWRRRQFKPAYELAGLERLRPYDLRHTAVSIAAALGWTGPEIQAHFGHRIDTSERVYQHLIAELKGKRYGSADELIAEARRDVFGESSAEGAK